MAQVLLCDATAVSFLPLELLELDAARLPSHKHEHWEAESFAKRTFRLMGIDSVTWYELPDVGDYHVSVLPACFHETGGRVSSLADPVQLALSLEGLTGKPMMKRKMQDEDELRHVEAKPSSDVPKAFTALLNEEGPWGPASTSIGKFSNSSAVHVDEAAEAGLVESMVLAEGATDDDSEIQALFDTLEAERAQWPTVLEAYSGLWRVSLVGGAWLIEHRSQAVDAFKAAVKPKSEAETWTLRHGLPRNARFQLNLYGYGVANDLAHGWCHCMHFLLQLGSGHEGPGDYHYTESDLASYVSAEAMSRLLQSLKGRQLARAKDITEPGQELLFAAGF